MKRLLGILVFCCLALQIVAQEETRVIDSLLDAIANQEGREKVLTMIELTWEFYDLSYDDCLDWGEKAINEAHEQDYVDLEAQANYVLGMQYAYHGDLDLAKENLQRSFLLYMEISDNEKAFESLWDIATYELTLGNMDTAYGVYEQALSMADEDFYYARACIYSNMALICQNKGQLDKAIAFFNEAKKLFVMLEDELLTSKMDYQVAVINMGNGSIKEAKNIFLKVLSVFEKNEEYYFAMAVCKELGEIYAYHLVNQDSSLFYLNKALFLSEQPSPDKESEILIGQEKVSVIVKIADFLSMQNDVVTAIENYNEALQLSIKQKYIYGQLEALKGLIILHGQLGQSKLSLQYYGLYSELESKSGITIFRSSVLKYVIMDYARLGQFDEMLVELDALDEEKQALQRENMDFYDRIRVLQEETQGLLSQYDSQNNQIQTLQNERNHYRLAFFGLLAIVLFVMVLLIAYKIVRKNRSKSVKP